MLEILANKKISEFLDAWDEVDSMGAMFGRESVEWLDAWEYFIQCREELHRLVILGLAQDL